MDIQKAWESALKKTEIIRSRVKALDTFSDTVVPYIFLSESMVNMGDTVVRKGAILVKKPSLVLPPNLPQFEGFEFEDGGRMREEAVMNFLLVRGVSLPSLKYQNQTYALDLHEGKLKDAITHYSELLQRKEDVKTGLLIGPDDYWQFSMLIFICSQVVRNAAQDIQRLIREYQSDNEKNS